MSDLAVPEVFDPYIASLALVAMRAARVSMGKPPDIERDGLGQWRMKRWMRDVRCWLVGDDAPSDQWGHAPTIAAKTAVLAEVAKRAPRGLPE